MKQPIKTTRRMVFYPVCLAAVVLLVAGCSETPAENAETGTASAAPAVQTTPPPQVQVGPPGQAQPAAGVPNPQPGAAHR